MAFIIESAFLLLIIGVTLLHAEWFEKNWPTGPLFHIGFSLVYIIPMVVVGWFWQHNWVLLISLATERFVFYNSLLNLMRGKPFFYLSVNNTNPSFWDHIEIGWSKDYPYVWAVSLLTFLTLQFFI